jgi:hypothetical protein
MFEQFGAGALGEFDRPGSSGTAVAQSGAFDALVALERIGARRSFAREDEIYAEGDTSDSWYRVSPVPSGIVNCCRTAAAT